MFFCSYGCTARLRTAGVFQRSGGPTAPLVRVGCSRPSARRDTLPDDPHVAADTPAVDSEVRNPYLLFFLFFTIVIVLSKLLFFQATRCRTTPYCAVGRGGQATSWGSSGGAVDEVQLRGPADRRVPGPVATRDAHVPPPRRRDDS
jgi:hypothetical protein